MSHALPMAYLVRHGDTAWTLTAQHTGRTDLPLIEHCERQARAVGARLAGLRIDRIFSSPLQRARRTAELAMPGAFVEADDDLMEGDYGTTRGRRTVDIEVERTGWRLFRDGCPGGETLDAGGARADNLAARLKPAAPRRRGRPPKPDGELIARIKAVIADMPTYSYRRVHAILRRAAKEQGSH